MYPAMDAVDCDLQADYLATMEVPDAAVCPLTEGGGMDWRNSYLSSPHGDFLWVPA